MLYYNIGGQRTVRTYFLHFSVVPGFTVNESRGKESDVKEK